MPAQAYGDNYPRLVASKTSTTRATFSASIKTSRYDDAAPTIVRHGENLPGPVEAVPFVVTLLGPFTIRLGERSSGPWPRPCAKRLCEFLMLRPDHRAGREVVREVLFANLAPNASGDALRKAVSMARQALSSFGKAGPLLLQADRYHIWVPREHPPGNRPGDAQDSAAPRFGYGTWN